jgi:hypothetical protein
MVRIAVLTLVFLGFAGLNVHVIETIGYGGFWQAIFGNRAAEAAVVDLAIAIGLITVWMWNDAQEQRLPFWPYAVVGFLLGSLGPLAYLIHRELRVLRATRPRGVVA